MRIQKEALEEEGSPRRKCILQERYQFVDKMGSKRRSKVEGGGRAAAEDTTAALEGGKQLSNRYEGSAEANPSNYVLLSVGGKVGAYKNRRDGGEQQRRGGQCKVHSSSEEQPDEVHDAQEADVEQGRAGGRKGGD